MSEPVAPSQAWTVGRLLNATRDFLASKGLDQPRLCAQLLLAHVLGCRRLDLYLQFNRTPDEEQITALRDLVRRSALHEPIAYLIGRKEFFSLDFRVTPDVLIPRPETETLVQTMLDIARSERGPLRLVLDLCTGCGCIAAALVTHLPDGKAVATDASVEALKVARENIRRLGLADRIVLRQGDLFEALAPEETGFDAIVSNPPYIRSEEVPSLSPAVTGYEPRAALDGGPDGLDHIRRIVAGAGNRLRPGGHLGIEVAYNQASVVCDLFEAAGLADVRAVPDGLGHQRVVVGSRPRANAR